MLNNIAMHKTNELEVHHCIIYVIDHCDILITHYYVTILYIAARYEKCSML